MAKIHVVMVDAQVADRRLMSEAFSCVTCCDFAGFSNGDDALQHMTNRGSADLLVCSLGTQTSADFVRAIGANAIWQSIPIAVFDSPMSRAARMHGLPSDTFVCPEKPFDFDAHVRLAAELVGLARPHSRIHAAA